MSFLSWAERTANIPEETITGERTATPAELVLLAEEFGVLELSQLTCSYKIRPLAGNRFSVRGKILASITQNCVVTLDPVVDDIEVKLDVEFWLSSQIGQLSEEFDEPDREDPEPIENDKLDIGRVVFELVSGNINPYPRAADAELDRHSSEEASTGQEHPFAALAQLKSRPDS